MYIATVPPAQKPAVVQSQQDWSLARMEKQRLLEPPAVSVLAAAYFSALSAVAKEGALKIREVVSRVHNDYTEWSGPQRVRDLLPDEAQYWSWSRHLAFGYFSKPPIIAASPAT